MSKALTFCSPRPIPSALSSPEELGCVPARESARAKDPPTCMATAQRHILARNEQEPQDGICSSGRAKSRGPFFSTRKHGKLGQKGVCFRSRRLHT